MNKKNKMNFEFDKKDYHSFLQDHSQDSSSASDSLILDHVKAQLNPKVSTVYIKLLFTQAVVGISTLLFCPQFSLSLTNQHDLFHFFHRNLGHQICMAICGIIFIGTGSLVAASLLRRNELKLINNNLILFTVSITAIAVTSFLFVGAQVYLDALAFWYLGAVLSSCLFFKVGAKLRLKPAY